MHRRRSSERAYTDKEKERADAEEKERMEAEYGESRCIGGEGRADVEEKEREEQDREQSKEVL